MSEMNLLDPHFVWPWQSHNSLASAAHAVTCYALRETDIRFNDPPHKMYPDRMGSNFFRLKYELPQQLNHYLGMYTEYVHSSNGNGLTPTDPGRFCFLYSWSKATPCPFVVLNPRLIYDRDVFIGAQCMLHSNRIEGRRFAVRGFTQLSRISLDHFSSVLPPLVALTLANSDVELFVPSLFAPSNMPY